MVENLPELPKYSDQWYIYQYLLYGSVEKALIANRWDVKISTAGYHRLVKKYGIIKSAGRREASLTELLQFFVEKALEPSAGIETIYYQMPPSFQTSLATLHRTYHNLLKSNHRLATGLVIHPYQQAGKILVGQEVSTKKRYGKYRGDWSIPLTFSQEDETNSVSVLRVLQQEVLSDIALSGKLRLEAPLTQEIIMPDIQPILNFYILDVCVRVYEVNLPQNLDNYVAAAKLENLQFARIDSLDNLGEFRTGVLEMLENLYTEDELVSGLNKALLGIPA